ncbi:MAG TPA: type II secretion system protein N [Usitatibacter sp.]
MRIRTLAILGIAGYAVFLVATIPATFVASRIASATQGAAEFTDVGGTVWNGSARAMVNAPGGRVAFDRVEWHFAPLELAAGHFAYRVGVDSNAIVVNAVIGRGWSRWILGPTEAKIEMSKAPLFMPLAGAWHPEGTVLLTSLGGRYTDDGRTDGAALVTWTDAAVSLSDVRPLGKYVVEMNANDGPVVLNVKTVGGALRISGHGSVAPLGASAFSGEARGDGDRAKDLEPLLDMLGPSRADGSRAIDFKFQR